MVVAAEEPPRAPLRRLVEIEESRLAELRAESDAADVVPYRQGEAVLRVARSGVFRHAPGGFTSAVAYVASRLGRSDETLNRRVRVVRVFSEAEYLSLVRDDVPMTTIARIAGAPQALRPELLKLARQFQSDTIIAAALSNYHKHQRDRARAERTPEEILLEGAIKRMKEQQAERLMREAAAASSASPPGPQTPNAPDGHAGPESPEQRERRDRDRGEAEALAAEVAALQAELAKAQAERDALAAELTVARSTPPRDPPPREGPPPPADPDASELSELRRRVAQQQAELLEAEQRFLALRAEQSEAAERLAQVLAERAAATTAATDATIDPQRAASLFEWEERLQREAARQEARCAEIDRKDEQLQALIADIKRAVADVKQREAEVERRQRSLEELRQNMDQREQDFLGQVLQTQQAVFRWSVVPEGLGGALIYIADTLDHLYGLAAQLLHDNLQQRQDQLRPGEMALGLEVARQLRRTEVLVRRVLRHTLEEFAELHPRLAEQELSAFEAAVGASALPGGRNGVGAAGLVDIPREGKLGEGFAVPIRLLAGTNRTFTKERGLIGTTPVEGGEHGVLVPLSRPLSAIVAGPPGAGKSNLLLVLMEMMAQREIKNISTNEKPALAVNIHLGLSAADYKSELAAASQPNTKSGAPSRLALLGATPQGLALRTVVFVPSNLPLPALNQRKKEYPGAELRLIRFGKKDRFPGFLRVLLNVEDNPADYLRWIDRLLTQLGETASFEEVLRAIELARSDKIIDGGVYGRCKRFLGTAAEWMAPANREHASLWDDLDGAHVIVDLRSDALQMKDAIGVVMALIGSVSMRRDAEGDFLPVVVTIDEFTKILAQGKVSSVGISTLTEGRHRRTSILLGCHDVRDLPTEVQLNAGAIIQGATESAALYEHLCDLRPGFADYGRKPGAALRRGQFMANFRDTSDPKQSGKTFQLNVRDACALPGGQTQNKADDEDEE